MTTSTHSLTLETDANEAAGVAWKIARPARNRLSVATDDPSSALFFLWWSTMEPSQKPETAVSTRKIPPMTEVEMTDLVVRYAQKIKANQTKLFVVKTSSAIPRSW